MPEICLPRMPGIYAWHICLAYVPSIYAWPVCLAYNARHICHAYMPGMSSWEGRKSAEKVKKNKVLGMKFSIYPEMFPDPPGVFCARSRPPTGHIVKKRKSRKQKSGKSPFIFPPICPLRASLGTLLKFCWQSRQQFCCLLRQQLRCLLREHFCRSES